MNTVDKKLQHAPPAPENKGRNAWRILLVSHSMGLTGAPHSLLRHAKYMLEAGYTVDVCSIDYYKDNSLESAYIEAGLTPVHIEDSVEAMARFLDAADGPYNLAVCNTICTYKCAAVLQQRGVPTVWFIRETKWLDWWFISNPQFARVFKDFYNLYAPSNYTAKIISTFNNRVKVLNNSVADSFIAYSPISETTKFGFIGSIIPEKGLAVLLKAYAECVPTGLAVELRIAGKGNGAFAKNLMEKSHSLDGVKWIGAVDGKTKREFFDSIDVLCAPSYDEPSGLTVMEGAMYGKAVITTTRTGAKYMVDSASGAVVEPGNIAALRDAMKRMAMLSRIDLRAMQKHSRELYLAYGTSEREREEVLRMVAENIGRPPRKLIPYREAPTISLMSRAIRKVRRILWNRYLRLLGRGALVPCLDETLFKD